MKAIVWNQYGSPDVLSLQEVEKPTPKADEVLLQVHMASVNPLDWHAMRGEPFLARFAFGLFKPSFNRLGVDVAGRVVAVGSGVTKFKVGDEVFGHSHFGSFGEYVCANPEQLVLRPENLSVEEAAAVAVAAITALQSLTTTRAKIQPGQNVLVNGAAGGVGTFTVQLAKVFGANVTGVCSTRNVEMVRSLGADRVIDYTKQDFVQAGKTYDLIIDNVGNRSLSELKRALTPTGNAVIVGFTNLGLLFQGMVLGPLTSKKDGQQVGMMETANVNHKDLETLRELLAARKIRTVIDRCYPLSETAEAMRYVETGHARAKVVLNVG